MASTSGVDDRHAKLRAMAATYKASFPCVPHINAASLLELQAANSANFSSTAFTRLILIDVRTPEEQSISYIPGAISADHFQQHSPLWSSGSPSETNDGGNDMKKSGDTAHLRAIDDTIIVAYCTIGYRSGMLAQRIRKAILDSPVLCLANPTAQDFGHWQIADAYTDDRGSKTEDDNAGDESDASDNASQDDGESKCHAAENKSTGIHVYNLDSGILAYTHTNGPLLYRGGGLCVNETTGTNAADNKNGSNSKGNDKMNGKDSSKDNGSEHADSNRRDKDAGVNGCSRSNSENSENKTGKHDLKEWHEGGGTGEITTKTSTHFQTILDGIAKRDARALPTKRLHVYGKRWNLAAEGYESVYFRHPILKFAWTFVKGALSTFGW